jgi:hypothetical protein
MENFLKQNLNSKFEISNDTETEYNLSSLNSFTDNEFDIIQDFKLIGDKKINIVFVSTESKINDFDNSNINSRGIQLWSVLTTNNDYEHTLLKNESLKDKIIDFFIKQDIDFKEDKEFSKIFYIVSKNTETVKSYFTEEMRQALLKFKDNNIIVEFKDNKIYVGTENNFQDDASILNTIVDFFNVV